MNLGGKLLKLFGYQSEEIKPMNFNKSAALSAKQGWQHSHNEFNRDESKHLHMKCAECNNDCEYEKGEDCAVYHKTDGDSMFVREYFDKAIDSYKVAIAINPEFAEAWNNLGVVYGTQRRYQEALDCFEKALQIDPVYENALLAKARALKDLNRRREALHTINRFIQLNNDNEGKRLKKELLDSYLFKYKEILKKGVQDGKGVLDLLSSLLDKVEKGNIDAQMVLVDILFKLKDLEFGLYFCEDAAQKGNAKAQYLMGLSYHFGDGLQQSNELAVYWYKAAAEQNHASALNNLGCCYMDGVGVNKDHSKAFECIKKSAELRDSYAYEGMGHCYYYGIGTIKDLTLAKWWWQKAADEGNQVAIENLKKYYNK